MTAQTANGNRRNLLGGTKAVFLGLVTVVVIALQDPLNQNVSPLPRAVDADM